MKSELETIRDRLRGVADPSEIRRIGRVVARRHRRDPDLSTLLSLAGRLWKSGRSEERTVAVHLLSPLERLLEAAHWPVFKGWMRGVRNRDHCDSLACELLGAIVARDRTFVRVLRHWAIASNPWFRRAAAMAVWKRVGQMGDVDAALSVCEPLMRDRHPAVVEAVDRVLAGCLASDAPTTEEFLERWKRRLPFPKPSYTLP